MINIKKGNGLTLQQSDKVGTLLASEAVQAGMAVGLSSTGVVYKASDTYPVLGFALNDYRDTDVISSNKQAILLLDGSSVIETDQITSGESAPAYGALVYADASSAGTLVSGSATTHDRLVGHFLGSRTLPAAKPSTLTTTQTWVDRAGTTNTATMAVGWPTVTVWEIKLVSTNNTEL